jgi:hypothetical protein
MNYKKNLPNKSQKPTFLNQSGYNIFKYLCKKTSNIILINYTFAKSMNFIGRFRYKLSCRAIHLFVLKNKKW